MNLEDYLILISSMDVNRSSMTRDYQKPVLVMTVIEMIEQGAVQENLFSLDDPLLARSFKRVWDWSVGYQSRQTPDLRLAFSDLEDGMFWHLKLRNRRFATLDDELYSLLQVSSVRDQIKAYLLHHFLNSDIEKYSSRALSYTSFAGTIYENGILLPHGRIVLTSRPQWEELSPEVMQIIMGHYEGISEVLTPDGKEFLKKCFPDLEAFYDDVILSNDQEALKQAVPLKHPLLGALKSIEKDLKTVYRHSCVITLMQIAIKSFEAVEEPEENFGLVLPSSDVPPWTLSAECVNMPGHCCILVDGATVYESTGLLIRVQQSVYLVRHTLGSVSVYCITFDGKKHYTGNRILLSVLGTGLHDEFSKHNAEAFEEIRINENGHFYHFLYNGQWYSHLGVPLDDNFAPINDASNLPTVDPIAEITDGEPTSPGGKIGCFSQFTKSPYVNLLVIALSDKMNCPISEQPSKITLDELSIGMLANAWELLFRYDTIREKYGTLTACIEHLIKESKNNHSIPLAWYSSKELVVTVLQGMPFSGLYEETMEMLQNTTPYSALRPWIDSKSKVDIMFRSQEYESNCLYSIHNKKYQSYIEINPRYKRKLSVDHDRLLPYFAKQFIDFGIKLG